MKKFWLLKGLKIGVFFVAMVALGGLAVMLLWNALMPAIFGLETITWIQSLGLLALSRILFGHKSGFGGGRHRRGGHGHWREKFAGKWAEMSDEEREAVKVRWGKSCKGKSPWDFDKEKGQAAG